MSASKLQNDKRTANLTQAGKGRVPGSVNKSSAQAKYLLTKAMEKLGGLDYLVKYGKKDPEGFLKLWIKLLPIQAHITGNASAIMPVVNVSLAPARVIDHETGKPDV